MSAYLPLSRSTISFIVSGLIEVFTVVSTFNARDLFNQAIKEIIDLFIKSNICLDMVTQWADDAFILVKTIAPQDNVELFFCALIVVAKLLGIYEFSQPYTHNKHRGEKFLEISVASKQRIFNRRSDIYKALS